MENNETGRRNHLSWSLILPGAVLLAALLVSTPTVVRHLSMVNSSQRDHLDHRLANDFDLNALVWAYEHTPRRRFPDAEHATAFLSLPGFVGEILVSLPTTWPESWVPKSGPFAEMWSWRALSWTFFALPFWWLAGRTLDALRKNERVRTWEMSVLAPIGTVSGVIGVGLFFSQDAKTDDEAFRWVAVSGFLWLTFGVLSIIAWRRGRRSAEVKDRRLSFVAGA